MNSAKTTQVNGTRKTDSIPSARIAGQVDLLFVTPAGKAENRPQVNRAPESQGAEIAAGVGKPPRASHNLALEHTAISGA